jgi:hypothetical protein
MERRILRFVCTCCDAPWVKGHVCAVPCTKHPDHAGRMPQAGE